MPENGSRSQTGPILCFLWLIQVALEGGVVGVVVVVVVVVVEVVEVVEVVVVVVVIQWRGQQYKL